MDDFSALYHTVVSEDSAWFFYLNDHYSSYLSELHASVVVEAACQLPLAFVPKKRSELSPPIIFILAHFSGLHADLGTVSDESLFTRYSDVIKRPLVVVPLRLQRSARLRGHC